MAGGKGVTAITRRKWDARSKATIVLQGQAGSRYWHRAPDQPGAILPMAGAVHEEDTAVLMNTERCQ